MRVDLDRSEALELLATTVAHLSEEQCTDRVSPRVPLLTGLRDKLATAVGGPSSTYPPGEVEVSAASMDRFRAGQSGEIGAALVVVGLSAERATKEAEFRDDMIRVAHEAGASLRQLAEASGLGRTAVAAIVTR